MKTKPKQRPKNVAMPMHAADAEKVRAFAKRTGLRINKILGVLADEIQKVDWAAVLRPVK